jgi:Zn-dependent M28 family amino/carboxypeptidase
MPFLPFMSIPIVFDGGRAFSLIQRQTSLGPRAPGTEGHRLVRELIAKELGRYCADVRRIPFILDRLLASPVSCCNISARFKGAASGPRSLLIGTHFDTRWVADRETTYEKQYTPIPGANDGGSGTAVLLELARLFAAAAPPLDVTLAFFDAEDVGDLEGYSFYEGSSYYASRMGADVPDEVLILDMVGGKEFNPDFDLNSLYGFEGETPFERLLRTAAFLGYREFFREKPSKYKCIGCDHIPFIERGIPSGVLIDIDYPQWHTQDDTPLHCSIETLEMVGQVTAAYAYSRGE